MLQPIYVLDLETTGLIGEPIDKAVEIGIARVDLNRGKVYPEYSRIIYQILTPKQKESWVFKNTDLTPGDVNNSPYGQMKIAADLFQQYSGRVFTSYNMEFDFGKFIDKWDMVYPINDIGLCKAPCLMTACANEWSNGEWFSAQQAYDMLCPDNPAGLEGGIEKHRALSDAIMEGWILVRAFDSSPEIMQMYVEVLEE